MKRLGSMCLLLLGASPAFAQGRGACKQDVERLCAGVPSGDGRVARCLESHASEASEACRVSLLEMREEMKGVREACKADVGRLCASIAPGQGRLQACLAAHASELSEGCQATLSKLEPKDACARDAAKLCPGIPAADTRTLACLKDHFDQLSEPCKQQTNQIRSTLTAMDKVCDRDVQTVCKEVQPGQGRLMACLKEHADQLSARCRALLPK